MKKLNLLLLLPGMLVIQNVFAQTDTHLKLSDQYPTAGEKISFSYDPSGTPVDGKKDLTAAVYFLDNKDYPVADVALNASGKTMTGSFTVLNAAKAFFIKISSDAVIDDNNTNGYIFMVYKDKQPVAGAYAMKGYWMASGMGAALAKIKTDKVAGLALFRKEFEVNPQSEKEYGANYYYMLAANKEYGIVNQKIAALGKSSDEKDLMLARNLLSSQKMKQSADSLGSIIKAKFPNGEMVKSEMVNTFYREKDLANKEAIYRTYLKQYPETGTEKYSNLDDFRLGLASAYLAANNLPKFYEYKDAVKKTTYLPGILNNAAWGWVLKGEHLTEAEKLSKESLELMTAQINSPVAGAYTSPKTAKKSAQSSYDQYADTYAMILLKTNRPAEALKYEEIVYQHQLRNTLAINEDYATILVANGQYSKAQDVAASSIKEGKSSNALKTALKTSYTKVKGGEAGYDDYLAGLEGTAKKQEMDKMAKTLINQPAPAFALKDLDGKTVSLAELKGKIVVVDFWATWCGPCKASFPGMQMAVNKYKDDSGVKFLFVDCWENDTPDKYLPAVKQFIADNKYTFHVLIDEKGADDRQSKVVSSFNVSGIPTKFIIDKEGNIRFKYVGYTGSSEAVLSEVTNMIDIAKDPQAATGLKVTKNEK
jgi:thiol-disulfide isomerase/thioredoxin/lambda repressor-like predicted transcriptional regulator